MVLSNVGERSRQAQVALTDIGVKALHIIVRSLAQLLIRIPNGNTWRLHCASRLATMNWSLIYSDIVAPVRRKKVPWIEKSSDDAEVGKGPAGSAEATATASRQIQITRTVKSFKRSDEPRPPAHSPRAKVQKQKKAKAKKTRRANLNPQCR